MTSELSRKILLNTIPRPRHAARDENAKLGASRPHCMITPFGFYSRNANGCHQIAGHTGNHSNSIGVVYPGVLPKRQDSGGTKRRLLRDERKLAYVGKHSVIDICQPPYADYDLDERAENADTQDECHMYILMENARIAWRLNALSALKREWCPELSRKYLKVWSY